MKSFLISLPILLMFVLLVGCTDSKEQGELAPIQEPQEQVAIMPEHMPDDFNFSVTFGITSKNAINTFEHTVTKDLATKGTAAADITLNQEEMKEIYSKMREINVLRTMKLELELDNSNTSCSKTPFSEDHWKIQLEGQLISLDWTDKTCTITEDAAKLETLRAYIFDIVKIKEAYKQLPAPVGGYD